MPALARRPRWLGLGYPVPAPAGAGRAGLLLRLNWGKMPLRLNTHVAVSSESPCPQESVRKWSQMPSAVSLP